MALAFNLIAMASNVVAMVSKDFGKTIHQNQNKHAPHIPEHLSHLDRTPQTSCPNAKTRTTLLRSTLGVVLR